MALGNWIVKWLASLDIWISTFESWTNELGLNPKLLRFRLKRAGAEESGCSGNPPCALGAWTGPGPPFGSDLKERIPKLKSRTECCIQSSDRGTRQLKQGQESDKDTRGGFRSSNAGPLEALEDKNRTDI